MKLTLFFVVLAVAISSVIPSCKKTDNGSGNGGGNGGSGTVIPASPLTGGLAGLVVDENNNPLNGVSIKAGTNTASTNSSGNFTFTNITLDKNLSLVTASLPGYFKGYRVFQASATASSFIKIQLLKRPTAITIGSASGGTVSFSGTSVTFEANSFADAATGAAYTGTVNVYAKLIDPSQPNIVSSLPGGLIGLDSNGKNVCLQSFGMLAVDLETSGGQKLQIATGKKATISYPITSSYQGLAPASIPLWYVDDATGIWKQEGRATRSGSTYTGTVSHFSFWNWDYFFPKYLTLSMRLKTSAGDPLAGALVKLSLQGAGNVSFLSSSGYTDAAGYIDGYVPADVNFTMQVISDCNTVLDTRTIGPFSQSTNLGDQTISLGANQLILAGVVKNCSDAPLANAQLSIFFENKIIQFAAGTGGTFRIAMPKCSGPGYTIIAKDAVAGQVSVPYYYQTGDPVSLNLQLKACAFQIIPYVVSTLAGAGFANNGWIDGTGTTARFWEPHGVATDAAGNVYVADRYNHRIRKITPAGVVTTLAGNGTAGFADGPAANAQFNSPVGIAVASDGSVYVNDLLNFRIRKISNGIVSTYVGTGAPTNNDGPVATATVNSYSNLVFDNNGNMFFSGGNKIRKVSNGTVSTYTGDDIGGYTDGPIASAKFYDVRQLAIDSLDNLYLAEFVTNRVRKVDPTTGVASTLAGLPASNSPGISEGGFGTYARLNQPLGITVGPGGYVYICESNGLPRIKKITPQGYVTTIAGNGNLGYVNGPGLSSEFQTVNALAADKFGNIYVADGLNQGIRKVKPQ